MKLRTVSCQTMNLVYDQLKTLSIEQLERFSDLVWTGDMPIETKMLMDYQVNETIRRKIIRKWSNKFGWS